jgi:hypothetical protein
VPAQRRTRHSDPASVNRHRAMPKTLGTRRLRAKSDGPGPQSSMACRCPPGSRSIERTRRSESQIAVLSIELPKNVLDALAERVAARVLEVLTDGQGGDRWLDAKQRPTTSALASTPCISSRPPGNLPPSRRLPATSSGGVRSSTIGVLGAATARLLPKRFHRVRCRGSPAPWQQRNPV